MKKLCALMAAVFAVCALISLSACGGGDVKKAEKAVDDVIAALKSADMDAVASLVTDASAFKEDDSGILGDQTELGKGIYGRLSCEVTSAEKQKDGSVSITADITNVDMEKVFKKWLEDFAASQASGESAADDGLASLLDAVRAEDAEMAVKTVDFSVAEQDGKWKVEPNADFVDAVSGGIVSTLGGGSE